MTRKISSQARRGTPFLTDYDLHLLGEGRHFRTFEKLGAHVVEAGGRRGAHFAVWAPNARAVSVIGDFNGWRHGATPLAAQGSSGIWAGFVEGLDRGALYKFAIESRYGGWRGEKADPHGFFMEMRPRTASVVWDIERYEWGDAAWMTGRAKRNALDAPISIYEVHLGSWRRVPEDGNRWLTYREAAPLLAAYVKEMGYTHVELLPITEHPFDGSWGYQTVGYYAPTSRFGTPDDFMFFVDTLHRAGIGVIMDWVPAHFPRDPHGLAFFDGTHLYEHADPRLGAHPHWGTLIFNYGRHEVANFLISNALFWLEKYHLDGLRVDAVASMLYLDYGRQPGEWVPNRFGGKENIEAVDFLRALNERVYLEHPDVLMIAEESTAWPMVSRPTYLGGLGFGLKWNMGWMHDTLRFFSKDPIHRSYHLDDITFGLLYAFTENFVLAYSHDEVVHLKRSMAAKMPGDLWQKLANLRLLYGFMMGHPGKKLLFMGGEIAQWEEWSHDKSLDWHLLDQEAHRGIQRWVRDLNALYGREPALHELDVDPAGFEWIDCNDRAQTVVAFLRRGRDPDEALVFAFNMTPVPRHGYRIGVPWGGRWDEVLNGDAREYGGSGMGNLGSVEADATPWHGRGHSIAVVLPPLAALVLKGRRVR